LNWAAILKLLLCSEDFESWLMDFALRYGYLGIFFASLMGALSIIVPIPYTALIFMLGKWLDPILLAISAGSGSALGEVFGYIVGYYGRALISEERRRKIEYLLKIFRKYGSITIFFFALTPLPDDLLFIPLGIMHYPLIKFFIPCFIGKTLMSLILAYGGRFSISILEALIGGEGGDLISLIATTVLLIVILIIMLKIDWEKILSSKRLQKYFSIKED